MPNNKLLIGIGLTGGLGVLGYMLCKTFDINVEHELQNFSDTVSAKRKQYEINKKTKELIISEFSDMIFVNCDITLEEAVTKFENVEEGMTLEEFAKLKNRTKESYLNSYQPYFEEARKLYDVC